jgi:hypothetical protein
LTTNRFKEQLECRHNGDNGDNGLDNGLHFVHHHGDIVLIPSINQLEVHRYHSFVTALTSYRIEELGNVLWAARLSENGTHGKPEQFLYSWPIFRRHDGDRERQLYSWTT